MIEYPQNLVLFLSILQFTDTMKEGLESEVKSLIEAINNPSMKEVKGLEDRLYGLEQLLFGARKLVQEQNDMAQVCFSLFTFTVHRLWHTIAHLQLSLDLCQVCCR